MNSTDGILDDPPAEALVVALADSSVNIRLYWWTTAPQHLHMLHLQDKVLTALKNRLVKSGIELTMPTQQIVLETLSENSKSEYFDSHKTLADGKL
jgi:small-conductance mechanosensitive channel